MVNNLSPFADRVGRRGYKLMKLRDRDLVKDDYGNYYEITQINNDSITIVNYFIRSTYNFIANEDFINDVKRKYGKSVGVGQLFTDMLKCRIETLSNESYLGDIHDLSEILEEYEVKHDYFYERNIGNK